MRDAAEVNALEQTLVPNSFEQLCILASKENWCWNIYCTTCGHLHFRYSFLELAHGKSPADADWLIHSNDTKYPLPFPRTFTDTQSLLVISICKEADLSLIADKCKSPDWLGYLGLVLHHFGAADHKRLLCLSWASQLKALVPSISPSHANLEAVSSSSTRQLSLRDLEMIETDWRLRRI